MQLSDKRPAEGALDSYDYGADQMEQSGTLPEPPVTPRISIKMAMSILSLASRQEGCGSCGMTAVTRMSC